jgi:hypothetical protein
MHQYHGTDNEKSKWVKLSFHGPQIRKVTNIFRDIPIQLAIKPTYTNFTPNKRVMLY